VTAAPARLAVRDAMTPDPACCLASTPLPEVARMLVEHDCGAIPVIDTRTGKKPVGIVTDRDIACRAVAEGRDPAKLTAGDCMSRPCLTVDEETSLEDACRLMEANRIRRIVVVDPSGQSRGILSQADIARHASGEKTAEVVRRVSQPTRSPSTVA
jgi:CBS domain-containing protein